MVALLGVGMHGGGRAISSYMVAVEVGKVWVVVGLGWAGAA